jgi:AcrR family transcriptional regulator
MPRHKEPPRKLNTEEMILEAAERLFGQHGLDGVSLRQIGVAAGSMNSSAVQYHFGTKEKLARAIFEHRLPVLELARAKLLAVAKRDGKLNDPRTLLSVMLLPIAEARDRDGRRSYAAFLLGLRSEMKLRLEAHDLSPLTSHISDLLESAAPNMPEDAYKRRFRHACDIFLSELLDIDREVSMSDRALPEAVRLADTLEIATATLLAPLAAELPDRATTSR